MADPAHQGGASDGPRDGAAGGAAAPAPRPAAGVRPAVATEAADIARLQVRAWRANHAAALGAAGARLDVGAFEQVWTDAVTATGRAPDDLRTHVLVAVAGKSVVGFAAIAPDEPSSAAEPVAHLVALEVDPAHTGQGHGSRLLAAVVDTARGEGFAAIRTWVLEDDGARAGFLRSAGLAPDGSERTLDVAGRPVVERSWSARC